MNLNFLHHSHATLRARGDDVTNLAPFARIVKQAQELMQQHKAAGIALPQLGVSVRIFVSKYDGFPVCANPTYEADGAARTSKLEGTMNKPRWHCYVPRWDYIAAAWIDHEGKEQVAQLSGMEARVFQHLTDACDGKPIFISTGKSAA
jgi:peptide deformylase